MTKFKKMDIEKKEDMIMARDIFWNGHDYLFIYDNKEILDDLIKPKFIYSDDTCVGIIEPELAGHYYQLFFRKDIDAAWTADILLDVAAKLYYENRIQVYGIKSGDLTHRDEGYEKSVQRHYKKKSRKIRKHNERLEKLQVLNEMGMLLNNVGNVYAYHMEVKPEIEKGRVKK